MYKRTVLSQWKIPEKFRIVNALKGTSMTPTENVNLVLSFKLAGENDCRVRGASRIKIDGRGGLTVYGAERLPERIELAELQSFSIHSLACAGKAA